MDLIKKCREIKAIALISEMLPSDSMYGNPQVKSKTPKMFLSTALNDVLMCHKTKSAACGVLKASN